jgi:hypothetical protein
MAARGLLGAAGVPGVGQLGQMYGAMSTAADLANAGMLAPSADYVGVAPQGESNPYYWLT